MVLQEGRRGGCYLDDCFGGTRSQTIRTEAFLLATVSSRHPIGVPVMESGITAFVVYFVRAGGLFLTIGSAAVLGCMAPFSTKNWIVAMAASALVVASGVLSWPRWPGSWRAEPPSDRQIAYAQNLGISIPAGITKGRLSDMIEAAKQVRG